MELAVLGASKKELNIFVLIAKNINTIIFVMIPVTVSYKVFTFCWVVPML